MTETTTHHAQHPAHETKKDRRALIWTIVIIAAVAISFGAVYLYMSSKTVYIDQSEVYAPLINLSPENAGTLQAVYVKEGDVVAANTPVAEVGNETIDTKVAGEIVSTNENIGADLNPIGGNATVVSMIDPTQLRIVGHLDENAGLDQIQIGDRATFTVDAFGSKQYQGVVDEVAPSSEEGDVVFNISNQRPTNEFDIYVRFDPTQYPELKNGMSARIWVYKQ